MNIKIKPEQAIGFALGALGLVQMALTNKKEANDRKALKAEVLDEVMKQLSKEE